MFETSTTGSSADGTSIARTRYGTDDADAAHEFLSTRDGSTRVKLGGCRENFRFDLSGRSVGGLGLARLRHSAGCAGMSDPLDYLVFVVIAEGTLEMASDHERVRATKGAT